MSARGNTWISCQVEGPNFVSLDIFVKGLQETVCTYRDVNHIPLLLVAVTATS